MVNTQINKLDDERHKLFMAIARATFSSEEETEALKALDELYRLALVGTLAEKLVESINKIQK